MDRFILIMKSDLRYFVPVLKGILAVLGGFGVIALSIMSCSLTLNAIGYGVHSNPLSPVACMFFTLAMVGLYVWCVVIMMRISDIKKKELHDFE